MLHPIPASAPASVVSFQGVGNTLLIARKNNEQRGVSKGLADDYRPLKSSHSSGHDPCDDKGRASSEKNP
jgi:hypothetical protein